jgi:protein tyrosine/serine phosphatase
MRTRNRIKIAILVILTLGAAYYFYLKEQGNFHAITAGEAYRSALLDKDELEHYVNKYNIKSILNLRGENMAGQWYLDEVRISAEHDIKHYDISISARSPISDYNVQRILKVFKEAPRPILIHCQYGADRSGLVAAMWKVVVDKEPKAVARKQLSLLYGHIPIGPTAIMDRFFLEWVPPQEQNEKKHPNN